MDAVVCLHLNILGAFEVKYVYVCQTHCDEYERELPKWIINKRKIASLHVECNRCVQMRDQNVTHE